jgi:hypothetical protein
MPSRARSQFFAFNQNDIGPSFPSEMVERANADYTATNYDRFGLSFHSNASWIFKVAYEISLID